LISHPRKKQIVFENMVLMGILGPKKVEQGSEQKKHNLYSLLNIIRMNICAVREKLEIHTFRMDIFLC
jgi:hypothetical protein